MKKIDKIFKNHLSKPQNPPEDSWDFISNALEDKKKKKRIIPIWIYWTSAASVLLVSFALFQNSFGLFGNSTIQNFVNNQPKSSVKTSQKNQNINDSNPSLENQDLEEKSNSIVRNSSTLDSQNRANFTAKSKIFSSENSVYQQSIIKGVVTAMNADVLKPKIALRKQYFPNLELENPNKESQEEVDFLLAIENQENKKVEIVNKIALPKLSLTAFAAPTMILNDKQSILSDEFSNKKLSNDLMYAYGAQVSFALNDKLAIRSGISKIDLRQTTQDIQLEVMAKDNFRNGSLGVLSTAKSSNQNINYNGNTRVMSNLEADLFHPSAVLLTQNSQTQADMVQDISFVEVPIEAEYKVLSYKKINVNLIAGGSTYFLTTNRISAEVDRNEVVNLGKAANLNDFNFSGNAAVKLQYNFTNKISVHLQPNVKYLLNSSKNVNESNPTLIGVQTGVSIGF